MKVGLHMTKRTALKLLAGCLLASFGADLQAQLVYKTRFSAVEGYTNGWAIGQPSIGNKWANANADFDWCTANNPDYVKLNNGCSWWPEGATEPWYITTITNANAPGGGKMMIASDGNFGTNAQTYFWRMDFPTQRVGPITVTWDWQFHCTNEIPADYDPTNNNYNGSLPGFDHGFTFSDWENRIADSGDGNPNWVYSELSTPFRLSSKQDARHNGIGTCGGSGDWNNYGPEFKDGKVLHMKLTVYVTNAPAEYMNSYDGWAQRDGEETWQTAFREGDENIPLAASGMRRCAGETDPASGINCLMLWMNGNQYTRYVTVSNVRVVGPNAVAVPTLSVQRDGANVTFNFSGWLQAADSPQGPYTDVAIKSPYTIPASTAAMKFFRAEN